MIQTVESINQSLPINPCQTCWLEVLYLQWIDDPPCQHGASKRHITDQALKSLSNQDHITDQALKSLSNQDHITDQTLKSL